MQQVDAYKTLELISTKIDCRSMPYCMFLTGVMQASDAKQLLMFLVGYNSAM